MVFNIANGKQVDIQVGDWCDIDPMYRGTPDPEWGFSVEIHEIDISNQIWAWLWNGSERELSVISPECFEKNFRQVPFEEE